MALALICLKPKRRSRREMQLRLPYASNFAVALLLLTGAIAHAGRTIRSGEGIGAERLYQPRPETLAVGHPRLTTDAGRWKLTWEAPPVVAGYDNVPFSHYLVYAGAVPAPEELITSPFDPFTQLPETDQPARFFSVKAVYGPAASSRHLRGAGRDPEAILDFEEGDLNLTSYSQAEDRQADRWELTDRQALPGSRRSLRLFGNTWKQLSQERIDLDSATVWQLGILATGSAGELQGFGIGDGENELIYTFHGKETWWDQSWQIANQDSRARNRWNLWRLAVGYDWSIRFGYDGAITRFFFINDNDTTNPAGEVYFDNLLDITGDIPPVPEVKVRWRVDPSVEAEGTLVRFLSLIENRDPDGVTLEWDFGDGTMGRGWTPWHVFPDGFWRVGITALGNEGFIGRKSLVVEAGEVRQRESILIGLAGDVMLARRYEEAGGIIDRLGPEAVFARIRHRTTAADMFSVNLECPLTDEGTPHPTKDITFRGRPENVAGLVYAGIDVATLANNHVSDYGDRGLEETTQVLDAAGIGWTGAGLNEYQSLQPVFRTVRGLRVGFLAYANRTGRDYNARPYLDAGFDKAGHAYFSADNIIRSVPDAAAQCDLLIIAVHAGSEYSEAPMGYDPTSPYPTWSDERVVLEARVDSASRELSHLAIDLGAGLVVQAHPHVLQGFEVYNGVVIASSMGNFAFDQNFWETWPSAILWAEVDRSGVRAVEIEPVFVDNYLPTPAVGSLGAKILDRLANFSRDLNGLVLPDYQRLRARVVIDQSDLTRQSSAHETAGRMRWIASDGVWRSEPLRLDAGGFPAALEALLAEAMDAGWRVRVGRELLLVGGIEQEGAEVWNFNSQYEGRDSAVVRSGRWSAFLRRNAGQQDAVTDLIQRIPVRGPADHLTLCGWLKTDGARNASLQARWFRFRYDAQQQNIYGDSLVEGRFSGDREWFYVWQDLALPQNAAFMSPRWQNYGPQEGTGYLRVDDVELIRWEEWIDAPEGRLEFDIPSDLFYMQVETRRPIETVRARYRTVRFE
ncbi:MAG: hypothetical protein FJY67_09610 [Calditrichaeota bacterium]|nr:hypothetical protein [Calditrichota bacterium]